MNKKINLSIHVSLKYNYFYYNNIFQKFKNLKIFKIKKSKN